MKYQLSLVLLILISIVGAPYYIGCNPPVPGTLDCDCPVMGKVVKECANLNTRHSRTCVTPNNGWFKAGENCSCEKIPVPKEGRYE